MRRWSFRLCGAVGMPNDLGLEPDFVLRDGKHPLTLLDNAMFQATGLSTRLQREFRRADLIHAHFGPDAAKIVRAARRAKRRLICTFHGYDATMSQQELGVAYDALFAHSSRIIAVSQFIRARLLEIGAPESKIEVCRIGIPMPPRPQSAARGSEILFVGRLVEKKGCEDLIRALSGMSAAPELVVVGDGPLRDGLERLAEQLRVKARFVGFQDPAAVNGWMTRAAALCVPSRMSATGDREGLPITPLEAAARELPTVGYRAAGVTEAVVDGETGLLAPEGDVPALARLIDRICVERHLAARLAASARDRVEREFDIVECTERLQDVYDDVGRR